MMNTSNPIIKHKPGLLNLAERLNNLSEVCKMMGVPRDTIQRYHELAETCAIDAGIN